MGWLTRRKGTSVGTMAEEATPEMGWLERMNANRIQNAVLMSQPLIFHMCMLIFKALHVAGNKNKSPVGK